MFRVARCRFLWYKVSTCRGIAELPQFARIACFLRVVIILHWRKNLHRLWEAIAKSREREIKVVWIKFKINFAHCVIKQLCHACFCYIIQVILIFYIRYFLICILKHIRRLALSRYIQLSLVTIDPPKSVSRHPHRKYRKPQSVNAQTLTFLLRARSYERAYAVKIPRICKAEMHGDVARMHPANTIGDGNLWHVSQRKRK